MGTEVLIQLDLFKSSLVGIDPLACDYSGSYYELAVNGQKFYDLKVSGLKYLSAVVTTSGVINFYVIPKCYGETVKVYCERC